MVMPLKDEDKPKCYLCHDGFENKDILESHKKDLKREPAPGDVTVF
jgi:hypothetical protein